MNRLAIDASTDRLSVAVAGADGRQAVRRAVGARRHAALLGSFVDQALGELGLDLDGIDRILLADGPGSFTGLRVGAAWVKGLALGQAVEVRTASTLLVRAARARPGADPARDPAGAGDRVAVLGVGSALRGDLFVAGYRFAAGRVETVIAPTVVPAVAPLPAGFTPDWIVGDWAAEFLRVDRGAARFIGPPDGFPDAPDLIALDSLDGGTTPVADLALWEPLYGRPAEAQARWEQQHGRRLVDSAGDAR